MKIAAMIKTQVAADPAPEDFTPGVEAAAGPTLPIPGTPAPAGVDLGQGTPGNPILQPDPEDPGPADPAAAPVALTPAPAPAPVGVDLTPAIPAPATPAAVQVQPTAPGAVNLDVAAAAGSAPTIKKGGIIMRGASAHNAVATEQAKADLAQAQAGFRFWIKVGQENRITFVDGGLDADGMLDVPYWYEHRLMIGGRIQNVTCYESVSDMGPCPVCAAGHRTQLVAGLTIVNHTPYTVVSGQNAGKTLSTRRQMFVAPRTAVQTLQQLAAKRGGLAAHCFDVYRKEKKDARVGSVFDYVGQLTQEQVNTIGAEEWKPYDWEDSVVMLEAAEMVKLGNIAVPYGGGQGSGAAVADLDEIAL